MLSIRGLKKLSEWNQFTSIWTSLLKLFLIILRKLLMMHRQWKLLSFLFTIVVMDTLTMEDGLLTHQSKVYNKEISMSMFMMSLTQLKVTIMTILVSKLLQNPASVEKFATKLKFGGKISKIMKEVSITLELLHLPLKKTKVFGENIESSKLISLPTKMIKTIVELNRDGTPTNLAPLSSILIELTENSLTMKAKLKTLPSKTIFSLSQFTQLTIKSICGQITLLKKIRRWKINLNLNSGLLIKKAIVPWSIKLLDISLPEKQILKMISIQNLNCLIKKLSKSLKLSIKTWKKRPIKLRKMRKRERKKKKKMLKTPLRLKPRLKIRLKKRKSDPTNKTKT